MLIYYFCFFYFSVGKVSIATSSSLLILSLVMLSLLMSLLKAFFIFNTKFLISSISFYSFFQCLSIFVLFGFVFHFLFVYCLYFFISNLNVWNCNFKLPVWKFQHLYHIWVCVLMGYFFSHTFSLPLVGFIIFAFFIYRFLFINL